MSKTNSQPAAEQPKVERKPYKVLKAGLRYNGAEAPVDSEVKLTAAQYRTLHAAQFV